MATTIEDGSGQGFSAKIDNQNRLYTRSITETEFDKATIQGDAFNINTEFLTITSGSEVPLLYFKNNEDQDLVIAAWFNGTDAAAGTSTRLNLLRVYVNPTGGTIISGGSDVIPVNRAIGSSTKLDADIKSGGNGFTFTGFSSPPILYQTQPNSARVFGNVQLVVKKGGSLVVTFQQYGTTSIDIYTGFQVYKFESL